MDLNELYLKLKSFGKQYENTLVSQETKPNFIKFKTGGMRAIMKEGFDGINDITANILGSVLVSKFHSIVLGYDHRESSDRFAYIIMKIFRDKNKTVTIFKYCTTPYLAWESLKNDIGVMVTASHNPKEYNGFKVYKDGCQVVNQLAEEIESEMEMIPFTNIYDQNYENEWRSELERNIQPIKFDEFFKSYNLGIFNNKITIIPIFSGIYGISSPFIREACNYFKMKINCNSIQNNIDALFPNIPHPNPENKLPWKLLVDEIGYEATNKTEEDAQNNKIDSLTGRYYFMCDPDGDRFGMANLSNRKLKIFNGNEIAKIFLWYFMKQYDKSKIALVSTFLCDDFFAVVSEKLNIKYVQTRTGFKYVSAAVKKLKEENYNVLAYEDTLGFLIGESTERDGVKACVIMYSILQETSPEEIFESYREYGNFHSYTVHIRLDDPRKILNQIIKNKIFQNIHDGYFRYEDQFKIMLRISGTESMLKVYTFTNIINEEDLKMFVDCWIESNITKLAQNNSNL